MEQREILVTLISAQNLKKVSTFGKMTVYCVAWIYPTQKVSGPMDKQGHLNPTWNATLKVMADERLVEDGNAVLTVDLYDHGKFGNTLVGSSTIPLSGLKPPPKAEEIKDEGKVEEIKEGKVEETSEDKMPSTEASSSSSADFMAVPVLRKSGKAKGTLNLSVKLGELLKYGPPAPMGIAAAPAIPYMAGAEPNKDGAGAPPVYAYPAAAPGYPPAYGGQPYYQQAPPYNQPGQPYYQQAPVPYYPPGGYAPPPPPRRSNGLGGGLGAGLVGGALGGLLIGSMLGGGCGGCGGF